MIDFGNVSRIQQIIGEKKEKKRDKNGKKKAREIFLLAKKRRLTYKPSAIAQTVNDLVARKAKDMGDIESYLAEKKREVTSDLKELYEILMKTKVSKTGDVKVTDTLTNSPLYMYLAASMDTRVLTNDKLWLRFIFDAAVKNKNTVDFNTLYSISDIKSAIFCSAPFEVSRGEFSKGYYQDYYENFSAIGMQLLTEEQQKVFLQGINNASKFIGPSPDNVEFSALAAESNNFVIWPTNDNLNANVLYKRITETKVFDELTESSSYMTIGPRKIEVEGTRVRYIDCKIKAEKFCPAFLILPEKQTIRILFKASIDYNGLFREMDNYYKNNEKKLFTYSNLLYWDTITQFFDFIVIYMVTSNAGLTQNSRQVLADMYSIYEKNKSIIQIWKKNQLNYEKLLVDFYFAFTGKANFDKLMNVKDKVIDYIKMRDLLRKDESYDEIKDLFTKCPYCSFIKNQFEDKIFNIADRLLFALEQLDKREDLAGLIDEFRAIGVLIFLSGISDEEKGLDAFPYILSQGAFLGSLHNGSIDLSDPLTVNLNRIQKQLEGKAKNESERISDKINLINNLQNNQKLILINTLKKHFTQDNLPLTNEEADQIGGEIILEIEKNPNIRNQINRIIIEHIERNQSLDNTYFEGDENTPIGVLIKKYKLQKQQQLAEQAQKQANDNVERVGIEQRRNEQDIKQSLPGSGGMQSTGAGQSGSQSQGFRKEGGLTSSQSQGGLPQIAQSNERGQSSFQSIKQSEVEDISMEQGQEQEEEEEGDEGSLVSKGKRIVKKEPKKEIINVFKKRREKKDNKGLSRQPTKTIFKTIKSGSKLNLQESKKESDNKEVNIRKAIIEGNLKRNETLYDALLDMAKYEQDNKVTDTDLIKYYTRLISLSGLYPSMNEEYLVKNNSLTSLIRSNPLSSDAINAIVYEYKMPDLTQLAGEIDTNKFPVRKYKDPIFSDEYINEKKNTKRPESVERRTRGWYRKRDVKK